MKDIILIWLSAIILFIGIIIVFYVKILFEAYIFPIIHNIFYKLKYK
jgi:cytochrome c oxidase assembly factor CtaG